MKIFHLYFCRSCTCITYLDTESSLSRKIWFREMSETSFLPRRTPTGAWGWPTHSSDTGDRPPISQEAWYSTTRPRKFIHRYTNTLFKKKIPFKINHLIWIAKWIKITNNTFKPKHNAMDRNNVTVHWQYASDTNCHVHKMTYDMWICYNDDIWIDFTKCNLKIKINTCYWFNSHNWTYLL